MQTSRGATRLDSPRFYGHALSPIWRHRLGDAEARRRAALQLPLRIRRGRRGSRSIFFHWSEAGFDLALSRRYRRDQPSCFDRPQKFERLAGGALAGLRSLIAESRIAVPPQPPPMAAGLFGYMGYETVRLMERLPDKNPDPIGIPDAVFLRPTVVAIFDNVEDLVTVVTPVWPDAGRSARQAYDDACKRLADVIADFDRSLPLKREAEGEPLSLPGAVSNITQPRYHEMVEQAKEYIRAGDIFQVVPSQRFSLPFPLPPFSLYRALRRLNPSPFLFFLDFGGFALVGSSPGDPGAAARRQGHHPPDRRHAAAAARRRGGPRAGGRTARRSQGAGRAPDAARSRPQRCRPRRRDRHASGHRAASASSTTRTSCTSSPMSKATLEPGSTPWMR